MLDEAHGGDNLLVSAVSRCEDPLFVEETDRRTLLSCQERVRSDPPATTEPLGVE